MEGFNHQESGWVEKATKTARGFDVIVDSAGGKQFSELLELALPAARVVIFGRTAGNIPEIPPRLLFWKQLAVLGTTMGTRDEFLSLLDFVENRKVKPVIDKIFRLEELEEAIDHLERGNQFGKIVLKI